MSPRLTLAQLSGLGKEVKRPAYDPSKLACGMVHLGVGAFHRAHQSVFTDTAIETAGGSWGVVGVSLRRPNAAEAINPQDGLYSVTRLGACEGDASLQVVGSIRRVLTAPAQYDAVLQSIASPATHVITITVTEAAYSLDGSGALDVTSADVSTDLQAAAGVPPRSLVGWLAAGLSARRTGGSGPLTIISCDNMRDNGRKLQRAVSDFLERRDPGLAPWLRGEVAFPNSMVDCITPASDFAFFEQTALRLGCDDRAAVRRETFAQWVIEDRFAAQRPAWENAGAELVLDVTMHEALKLHVLNAAHSTLAYIGLSNGHTFVREAMADKAIASGLDAMMAEEVAPALPGLPVMTYWRHARLRFLNPNVDHHLAQIAHDGAVKLRERIHPLILTQVRAGRPIERMAEVVRTWLAAFGGGGSLAQALQNPQLFDDPFRSEAAVRAALLGQML